MGKRPVKKSDGRTRQRGGVRNSHVAPRAFHDYHMDLFFFITDKQFPKQDYPVGMNMIDVFNKFAVVIPSTEHKAIHIMPAIFKAFTMIGKQS